MNYEELDMEKRIKAYVEEQYTMAKKYPNKAKLYRTLAYEMVQFAANNLFDGFNQHLANWWLMIALPDFNDLI